MSIYKIIENGNPVLKVPLTGVSEDCNREELKSDLIETMKEHGGIGLSANQVGVMERVFIFYEDFKTRNAIACFNPKIIEVSDESTWDKEGCLTWPGLWLNKKRPVWCEVEFEDENGELKKEKYSNLEARVFQHDYEHMEGLDFTSGVSKLKLDMAIKRRNKQRKKAERLRNQLNKAV